MTEAVEAPYLEGDVASILAELSDPELFETPDLMRSLDSDEALFEVAHWKISKSVALAMVELGRPVGRFLIELDRREQLLEMLDPLLEQRRLDGALLPTRLQALRRRHEQPLGDLVRAVELVRATQAEGGPVADWLQEGTVSAGTLSRIEKGLASPRDPETAATLGIWCRLADFPKDVAIGAMAEYAECAARETVRASGLPMPDRVTSRKADKELMSLFEAAYDAASDAIENGVVAL